MILLTIPVRFQKTKSIRSVSDIWPCIIQGVQLTTIDWLVVALYFALNIGIGFYYKARAGSSVSEFFFSGRNVPWWLAGTSMVATTFAADTPLVVTGLVATRGIAGNWLWWNFVASGMLTVFFYARLWRRSGVMTDIEFSEIRYSGKPAAFLRGFRALYLGIPINCIILGWVNLAMVKILTLVLGVTKTEALLIVIGLIAITSFISTLSGLWGVLVTDMVQFVIKMTMVIVLAVAAVHAVGGMGAMKAKLVAIDAARHRLRRRTGLRPELYSRSRFRLDAGDHLCRLHIACTGGPPGIPAPNRAAEATSRSACFAPKTNGTRCSRRCGSTSRITPCGRGPGSSSVSHH